MNENHPKRRKDKYNPYILSTTADGRHWIEFTDGQRIHQRFEIGKALFNQFNTFELDDLAYLNEADRRYEHSEQSESSLNKRAIHREEPIEEKVIRRMEYERLYKAIAALPEIQKRRVILYYFGKFTYEQIAGMEGCTIMPVKRSIDAAIKNLKKFLN